MRAAVFGVGIQAMSLRIGHIHHYPFIVAVFQCVLHGHSTVHGWIALWMKGDSRIGHILLKRHISGVDIDTLQVETGVRGQPAYNCFLDFLLSFQLVMAGRQNQNQQ